jgi:hypothetical protein
MTTHEVANQPSYFPKSLFEEGYPLVPFVILLKTSSSMLFVQAKKP